MNMSNPMPTSPEQAKAAVERLQAKCDALPHNKLAYVKKDDLRTLLALLSQCRDALGPVSAHYQFTQDAPDTLLVPCTMAVKDLRDAAALVDILPPDGEV